MPSKQMNKIYLQKMILSLDFDLFIGGFGFLHPKNLRVLRGLRGEIFLQSVYSRPSAVSNISHSCSFASICG